MERETKTNVEMKRETKTNAERANAFLTYVTPTIEQISRLRDVALDYTNKTKKAIRLLTDSKPVCFDDNEVSEDDYSVWDEFRAEMLSRLYVFVFKYGSDSTFEITTESKIFRFVSGGKVVYTEKFTGNNFSMRYFIPALLANHMYKDDVEVLIHTLEKRTESIGTLIDNLRIIKNNE